MYVMMSAQHPRPHPPHTHMRVRAHTCHGVDDENIYKCDRIKEVKITRVNNKHDTALTLSSCYSLF